MDEVTKPDVAKRMRYVVDRLVDRYGFPVDGAAGIVGNLCAESAVMPDRIEGSAEATPMRAKAFDGTTVTFTADQIRKRDHAAKRGPKLPGVGLAQWTSAGRREGLFNHRYEGRVHGPDILFNMDAQIDYLNHELTTSFGGVHAVVHGPGVTLDAASDEVVYSYEIPGAILGNKKRLPRDDPKVQKVFKVRRSLSERARREYEAKQIRKADDDMPTLTAACVDSMGRGWFFYVDEKGQAFGQVDGAKVELPECNIIGDLTVVASTVKPGNAAHGPIDLYGRGSNGRYWTSRNDATKFSAWRQL